MVDSFEIQTESQVKAIESRKIVQDMIELQSPDTNIVSANIENQISNIADTIDSLNDINTKIDNIDTNILEAQFADILVKIQAQQEQINSIEEKIDMLLEKT